MLSQIASRYNSSALTQPFDRGTIDKLNGGPYTGTFGVKAPIFAIYAQNGAEAGTMGFPVTGEILLSSGMRQQAFERGAISYDPATLIATQQPPVASVAISTSASIAAGGSLQMPPGGTLPAQASLAAAGGIAVSGRPVTWTSSNTKVVQVQGTGTSVVLYAVGTGSATVTASAEGQSALLNVTVSSSYCCAIGQGSPTTAIQQAFQDAVSRDGLSVAIPTASGVTRIGAGYVQQLTGSSGATYLVGVADSSSAGYVVMGAILAQYLQLGGPAGVLGYPLSDATTGGRQLFQNGALAGSPVQLVTGAILSGWKSLGYETGLAGSPIGAWAAFVTFRGTTGLAQSFQAGSIFAATNGSLAGQPYLVSGAVLATYNAAGGSAGDLGAPITLERPVSGQQRQDFEGGYIYYTLGSSQATAVITPRQPLVTATPAAVRAGTSAHLVLGGFANGATVRVSQTGQADFLVTPANGTYAWDSWVPASATAGTITVKAAAIPSLTTTAQATYSVYTTASSALTISGVSGNQQNGAPGANLPLPLVVAVKDQNGNAVAGQAVAFAASAGAQVQPATSITDAGGMARANLRMPSTAGVALATATAGRQVATFSAVSAAFSLTNFPALTQAVTGTLGNGSDSIQNKGALLTAAASILRYHQSRGELPQPNGLADAVTLNQFLTSFCATDSQGNKTCDGFVTLGTSLEQTVNLWRLGAFVSNSLTVQIEPFDSNSVRDLVVSGAPLLLALSLNNLGSHFVVASGVASDGSVLITDPNPAFAQTNLNGYLNGFTVAGQRVQGVLTGAARLLPQAPSSPGFFVASTASITLGSAAGSCGVLTFPGAAAVAGATPTAAPGALYFTACDGSSPLYELDIASVGPYSLTFTDLSPAGSRVTLTGAAAASWKIAQANQQWSVGPLTTIIAGVLNTASYTDQIAIGGLISIFGAGLAGADVQIAGQPARVIAATPFQLNAQIPSTVAPGPTQLTVTSSNGNAQQQIGIGTVAPAIFSISSTQAAITNSDNSLNRLSNPAARGGVIVIYATGFGATSSTGAAATPITVVIGGTSFSAAYAGISPGTPGLYQVNVVLPADMPPGLALPLYLKQDGATSNTVTVAVE